MRRLIASSLMALALPAGLTAGQISVVTPPTIVVVVPTANTPVSAVPNAAPTPPAGLAPVVAGPAPSVAPALPAGAASIASATPAGTIGATGGPTTGISASVSAFSGAVAGGVPPVAIQSFNVGSLSAPQTQQAIGIIQGLLANPGSLSSQQQAMLRSQLAQMQSGQ